MLEPRDIARYERELKAMIRRAAGEDPEGIAVIYRLLESATAAMPAAMFAACDEHDWTYRQLATACRLPLSTLYSRMAHTVLCMEPAHAVDPLNYALGLVKP